MPLPEWIDQLAATAMLGTERAGNTPLGAPGAATLDPVIEQIPPTPPEHALLTAASIASVYTRAGALPAQITAIPSTAPATDKPPVSNASAQHLALMLKDHHAEVLPEYLGLVASANRSLPPKYLPALLSLAARDEKIRARIVPILGPRGQWIAAQNRDWSDLSATPESDLYHTGTAPQRLAVLRHLRATDPARARTLITSTWSEEKPADRAAFLETLATNLSMEDEPFLESALDDKRKEVRTTAANLLAGLTQSRLATRMMARLTPLITLTKKLLGQPKLHIDIPKLHDPDMTRDGIDFKSAHPSLGEKASYLASIIAATPLYFWRDLTGFDEPTLLKHLTNHEWKDAALLGIATAAIRQKNAGLIAGLITYRIKNVSDTDRTLDSVRIDEMISLLTPAQRELLLGPLLAQTSLLDSPILMQVLVACRHSWTPAFSDCFVPVIWRLVGTGTTNYWGNQGLSNVFGLYAHPAILSTISPHPVTNDPQRPDALDKFLAILQFRHDLHKELSK